MTDGKPERATTLANELVRLYVDLIVTVTTPLAVEARRASATVTLEENCGTNIWSVSPVQVEARSAALLVQFSIDRRVATMTDVRGALFISGILMTYSPSPVQLGQRAADFIDRILKGERPRSEGDGS